MRLALVSWVVNKVSCEARAETANFIYRQSRISGWSGILLKKDIVEQVG